MNKRKLICLILAAGKGTRMKSHLPKVLHQVAGLPMLTHVIRAAERLNPDQIIVVIGPEMDKVAHVAAPYQTVTQYEQLGTGHAVRTALVDGDLNQTDVLVLYGDVPLVDPHSLMNLYQHHLAHKAAVTLMAMRPVVPTGYGRVIVTNDYQVSGIIEELDATNEQRQIDLCSSGVMLMRGEGLNNILAGLKNDNAKKEYYLTDVLSAFHKEGQVCTYTEGNPDDLNGVNDRVQLAMVEQRLQKKLRRHHMASGVTLIDPDSIYFSVDTDIEPDVIIEPHVFFGPGVFVQSGVRIKAFCHLEHVKIGQSSQIGPFARLREESEIGDHVHIGNFVEVKKSTLDHHVKASHLTYLCDLDIGCGVNIGAGAIFSNYDGQNKHRTSIGDHAFLGANTTIVSPVEIGKNSYISAGSVITEDVPHEKLAFGRAYQVNREHTEKTKKFSDGKKKE